MTDHSRLTRYTPYVNGTAFMGMLRQNDAHPEMFGPSYDWTQGPYVLAAEADAEIERLRAENARFRKLYHLLARDVIFFSQYDEDTNTWPDCGEFFAPCVLLNDTFAYATADAERVTDDQLDTLITVERQFGNSGVIAWAAQVRGSEPLEPYRTENYRAAREWLRAQEKREVELVTQPEVVRAHP